jgi:hypothetical protein
MLKPGGKTLEIAAKDPLLARADGLAFGEKTILYVNSVTGKLLRNLGNCAYAGSFGINKRNIGYNSPVQPLAAHEGYGGLHGNRYR